MSITTSNPVLQNSSKTVEIAATGIVVVGGLSALYATYEYSIIGGVCVLIPLAIVGQWMDKYIRQYRHNQTLKAYRHYKMPIFVIQQSKEDDTVRATAEMHKKLLEESENPLYKAKKIEVVKIYWGDARIRFTENEEEYWQRVEDFKRDYLDTWAKKIAHIDEDFAETHFYNQRTVTPEVVKSQFPLLTALLGK